MHSHVTKEIFVNDSVDSGVLTIIVVRDFNGVDLSNFHGQVRK